MASVTDFPVFFVLLYTCFMYFTYTRHTVKEYDVWRKAFDDNAEMLKANGVVSTTIVQVNDNPRDIAVLNTWPAKKNWEDFIAAHAFKSTEDAVKAREKAGVIGQPEWYGGEVV